MLWLEPRHSPAQFEEDPMAKDYGPSVKNDERTRICARGDERDDSKHEGLTDDWTERRDPGWTSSRIAAPAARPRSLLPV